VADFIQFGSGKAFPDNPLDCAHCEEMLADALDGTLSPAQQSAFDLHIVGCPACSSMLADAQRGAAWLEMLRTPRPEPSAALLDRILAQTGGHIGGLAQPQLISVAEPTIGKILPFRTRFAATFRPIRETLLQPRLAMTAAMAFFSIALTLNLTGVRLSAVRLSDLRPTAVKRAFYQTNASVVRYADNLPVVYQLESQVQDLKRSWNTDPDKTPSAPAPEPSKPGSQPDQQPEEKPQPHKPGQGTSRRESLTPQLFQAAYALKPEDVPVTELPVVASSCIGNPNLGVRSQQKESI
jgi:hypothetical protein